MLLLLLLVLLVLGSALVLMAMSAYDQLLVIEREQAPESWMADGRPSPFLRRDTSDDVVQSRIAAAQSCIRWAFATPEWLRGNAAATRLLWRIRLLLAVWTLFATGWFVLVVMSGV